MADVNDSRLIPAKEIVAKSIKASNHEGHEEHKGKEKLFFVSFVAPFFSGLFVTPSKEAQSHGEEKKAFPLCLPDLKLS